jgi:nitrogen fixation protein FixH
VLSDVEISRALNAVSTTLRDQRASSFDPARVESIAAGAIAGEPRVEARATGPTSGELHERDGGRLVATIALREGRWTVERELAAGQSRWAVPR